MNQTTDAAYIRQMLKACLEIPSPCGDTEEISQFLKKELESMGFTPKITKYNFCTNGSHYAGEANIKTIGMGPSVESLAHTVDEYCTLEVLEKVAGCYYGIMKALLK